MGTLTIRRQKAKTSEMCSIREIKSGHIKAVRGEVLIIEGHF